MTFLYEIWNILQDILNSFNSNSNIVSHSRRKKLRGRTSMQQTKSKYNSNMKKQLFLSNSITLCLRTRAFCGPHNNELSRDNSCTKWWKYFLKGPPASTAGFTNKCDLQVFFNIQSIMKFEKGITQNMLSPNRNEFYHLHQLVKQTINNCAKFQKLIQTYKISQKTLINRSYTTYPPNVLPFQISM